MQPPEDLKGKPIVGGPNSPTQSISGLLEKKLTPIVSCLKTYIKDEWDFIRKLPSHVDYPCVLASCDVVSLYTSIPHDLGLEALSYWINKKRNLIPERFTKAFILEAASFILLNSNFQFVSTHYSNFDSKSISITANSLLSNVKDNRLKKVYDKYKVIHALKQPKNLLRLLRKPKVQTCISEKYGLYHYECKDSCCNLCILYIQECSSFILIAIALMFYIFYHVTLAVVIPHTLAKL